MSKHPIPDWLRSQFSRIEDEVRKLGPCGVFTQMRTVTQTYFEQLAAAPQPPALGGEHETFKQWWDSLANKWVEPSAKIAACQGFSFAMTKVAPLQAEIERLNEKCKKLQRTLDLNPCGGAVCDEDPDNCENNEGHGCDCSAALSKPAGSEQI